MHLERARVPARVLNRPERQDLQVKPTFSFPAAHESHSTTVLFCTRVEMEELGVWARLLIVVVLLVVPRVVLLVFVQLLVEVHVLLLVLSVLLVLLVLLCMAVAVTNVKRARKRPLVGRVVGIGHLFFILHLLHHTPKDTCTSTRFASSSDSDRDL
jgi:hypothetical protein